MTPHPASASSKDAARALCAAGKAFARGAEALALSGCRRRRARCGRSDPHWLYVRRRASMKCQRVEGAARGARRAFHPGARSRGRSRSTARKWLAATRRTCRRAATRSNRVHPEAGRGTPASEPGRHAHLLVLASHRYGAQSYAGEIVGRSWWRVTVWEIKARGAGPGNAWSPTSMGMGEPFY